jgi:hypothetical protein
MCQQSENVFGGRKATNAKAERCTLHVFPPRIANRKSQARPLSIFTRALAIDLLKESDDNEERAKRDTNRPVGLASTPGGCSHHASDMGESFVFALAGF